jgi:hypothetical protein
MANLNILMSVGSILLFALWLYHPGPVEGVRRLRKNVPALLMIGLFLMHFVWLINTTDFQYAFKDIRIKLPLLIFGLVFGSTFISQRQRAYIFAALGVGLWVASLTGYYQYFFVQTNVLDHRSIVTGISHIRLSVLMVIFVAAVLYYWRAMSPVIKLLALLSVANVIFFFNLIQAATGSVLLAILTLWAVGYYASRRLSKAWNIGLTMALLAGIVAASIYTFGYYQKYFVSDESTRTLETVTALGNPYHHMPGAGYVENGHYIFINMCREELIPAWNERSNVAIDDNIPESEALIGTLTRYLTSKGLSKDRAGVYALTSEDIHNIEQGIPSIIYAQKSGLALRYHTFLFGIHTYSISGNASGLSFLQRVVYWDAAVKLIAKKPLLGTGTGDVKSAFLEIYDEMETNLEPKYRNRAHNQFLSFFVSFGILGFLYFLSLFVVPVALSRPDFLYLSFLLIAFVACLTEDTLETQAGATIFSFFYGLFASREKMKS